MISIGAFCSHHNSSGAFARVLVVVVLAGPVSISAMRLPDLQLQPPPGVPQFEVATVRINKSGGARGEIAAPPGTGRLTITNMTVTDLIQSAYGLQLPSLLEKVPDWVRTQRVDVVAKAESPAPMPALQQMLQPLLAERFKLAIHTEMRTMDALAIVQANKDGRLGPKFKRSDADCPGVGTTNRLALAADQPVGGGQRCGILPGGVGRIVAAGIEMRNLAALLAPSQRRPIIDQTGLTDRYDIDLTYTPEAFSAAARAVRGTPPPPDVDPNGPPLATALEEQAGLRLRATRAPVEVVVIDRIELPTEN
jgi:uncharacterized protein (TIGR03435 family)